MFKTPLYQLQQRYTYRQRFLLIVVFFLCALPYPTYWLFNTQSVFLEHAQRKEIVLNNLSAVSELLYQTISYRNNLLHQGTLEENSTTQKLAEQLTKIQNSLAEPLPANFSLGEEFQWNTSTIYLIQALKNITETIFDLTFQEDPHTAPQLVQQINLCTEVLHQLALATGFYLSDDKLRSAVLNATVAIPHMQTLLLNSMLYPQIYLDELNTSIDEISRSILPLYSQFKSPNIEMQQQARNAYQAAFRWKANVNILQKNLQTSASNLPYGLMQTVLNNGESWRSVNNQFVKELLKEREQYLMRQHQWSMALLVTFIGVILICAALRVLTKHLTNLLDHLGALAHGDFSIRSYPNVQDSFAQVGLTLNSVACTLSDISGRIRSLCLILADSSDHLSYEARAQEINVLNQEASIHSSTHIAAQIATNCRRQADIINELNYKNLDQPLAQNIQQALSQMSNTLAQLADSSHWIISELTSIQEHLHQALGQSNLLSQISDEAHQLAINAAIEANHPTQNLLQTHIITQAIQRFSSDTAQAVKHIRSIIDTVFLQLFNTQESFNKCTEVMTDSNVRLNGLKNELSAVADQTILQTNKFGELNQILQQQAYEAENIISALISLQTSAQASTQIFEQLSSKVNRLGGATEELKELMIHFFSNHNSKK